MSPKKTYVQKVNLLGLGSISGGCKQLSTEDLTTLLNQD